MPKRNNNSNELVKLVREDEDRLTFADLELSRSVFAAVRGERLITLSRREFDLLEVFLKHPRQVLSKGQLYEQVWQYDFGGLSNTLAVHVRALRRKLGLPPLIQTIRGVGYVLEAPDSQEGWVL